MIYKERPVHGTATHCAKQPTVISLDPGLYLGVYLTTRRDMNVATSYVDMGSRSQSHGQERTRVRQFITSLDELTLF
jgi:hypothetical protein